MKKFIRVIFGVLAASCTPFLASAGLLTGQGLQIQDQTSAQRATFSTNETIGFLQIVNNGV